MRWQRARASLGSRRCSTRSTNALASRLSRRATSDTHTAHATQRNARNATHATHAHAPPTHTHTTLTRLHLRVSSLWTWRREGDASPQRHPSRVGRLSPTPLARRSSPHCARGTRTPAVLGRARRLHTLPPPCLLSSPIITSSGERDAAHTLAHVAHVMQGDARPRACLRPAPCAPACLDWSRWEGCGLAARVPPTRVGV